MKIADFFLQLVCPIALAAFAMVAGWWCIAAALGKVGL